MDRISVFIEKFKKTPEWEAMAATVENSPWHREESVAKHTEMVLDFYNRNFASRRSHTMIVLTKLAILFHDVGKPAARTPKTRPDGTMYHIYAGHEQISARMFEDFMMRNWEWAFDLLRLNWYEFRLVKWMIEHHLPFSTSKREAFANLKRDTVSVLHNQEQMFYDLMLSDCSGRISDNHADKIANTEKWINDFKLVQPSPIIDVARDAPVAYILIGASGSGKSTFIKNHLNTDNSKHRCETISLDKYRLDFAVLKNPSWNTMDAKALYQSAFTFANEHDAEFRTFYTKEFNTTIAKKVNVAIDNTNPSRKARAFWIAALRQRGYQILSVEFPVSLETVLDRQNTRTDKTVPEDAVRSQYFRICLPSVGVEVDNAWIFHNNLAYFMFPHGF